MLKKDSRMILGMEFIYIARLNIAMPSWKLIQERRQAVLKMQGYGFGEVDPSMPSWKTGGFNESTRSGVRYYKPPHPKTGKPAQYQSAGGHSPRRAKSGDWKPHWRYVADDTHCFQGVEQVNATTDRTFCTEVTGNIVSKSVMRQYSDGGNNTYESAGMFGVRCFPNIFGKTSGFDLQI